MILSRRSELVISVRGRMEKSFDSKYEEIALKRKQQMNDNETEEEMENGAFVSNTL